MSLAVAILAAGQGTRMRSALPKVLHELAGRPLLDHVLDLALDLADPARVVVVVGHRAELVASRVAARGVVIVHQEPQLGTGDALRVALDRLVGVEHEALLVLSGDVPLLRRETTASLVGRLAGGAGAVLLSALLDRPGAYGRVVRDRQGQVSRVVEAGDADPATLALREVNAGVYAFRLEPLRRAVARLAPDNAQREYYLTDVVALIRADGARVEGVVLDQAEEMQGVNSRADLAEVARLLNRRVLRRLMEAGVTVLDPTNTWVEPGCEVGQDVVLEPGVHLRGACRVGAGARVGANTVLDGVEVLTGEVVPPLSYRSHGADEGADP